MFGLWERPIISGDETPKPVMTCQAKKQQDHTDINQWKKGIV